MIEMLMLTFTQNVVVVVRGLKKFGHDRLLANVVEKEVDPRTVVVAVVEEVVVDHTPTTVTTVLDPQVITTMTEIEIE